MQRNQGAESTECSSVAGSSVLNMRACLATNRLPELPRCQIDEILTGSEFDSGRVSDTDLTRAGFRQSVRSKVCSRSLP